MVEIELKSSAKAVRALNYWAINPVVEAFSRCIYYSGFIRMTVLAAWRYMCAWYLWRSEEGAGSPGMEVAPGSQTPVLYKNSKGSSHWSLCPADMQWLGLIQTLSSPLVPSRKDMQVPLSIQGLCKYTIIQVGKGNNAGLGSATQQRTALAWDHLC